MKKNWPVKKLGEICDVRDGTHDSPKYQQVGIPLITSKNLKDYGIDFNNVNYISEKDHLLIDKRSKVSNGDILFGMIGTIGNPVVIDSNIKFSIKNVGLIKFTQDKVNNYYIYYFLQSDFLRRTINSLSRGGTQNFVSLGDLRNLLVPVPTKEEQKKIVERLDEVREAQELCDQQIQKTEELFDSLIFKELEVLEIETQTLDKVCSFQYGYTQSASDVGKYRFIRITDIDDYGEIRNDDEKFISDNLTLLKPYILSKEDLLVARTGATYGKVLLFNLDQPSIFASFLIRIIPDKTKILPKFIWLFSRSKTYWEQAGRLVSGTGQPQFNANKIKEIKIKIPNLEEQQRIVEKLEAVQNYKRLLVKQKGLLKELFDSVLDKSMKGELDD